MGFGTAEEPALAVTISREKDDLVWQVENVGARDLWVFLLVPSIVDGRRSFAADTAWLEEENDGTLVARKVDTPAPEGIDVDDLVRSGAILMKRGTSRRGRLTLGREVEVRRPYGPSGNRVKMKRVVLEVGWVPFREEAQPELLDWRGQPFAYIFTANEPGGQRFTRSAPLEWAP
jgi:hypothetical protein